MDKKNESSMISKVQLEALANQLSCPKGEKGIEVAELMSDSNEGMITKTIDYMRLSNKNRILELGYGNCSHLKNILRKAPHLKYFGMEVSRLMKEEAERVNFQYVQNKQASFQLYNGTEIDYVSNFFDCTFTVNTIYFWRNPIALLNDIYRVLKPNGNFVLTYVKSSFMEHLPFVSDTNAFELYDSQKLEKLVGNTQFKIIGNQDQTERVKNKLGEWVFRDYTITVLQKNV